MRLLATKLSATGGNGNSTKPRAYRVNFVGDSITDASQINVSATNLSNMTASFANWCMAVLRGRSFANYNPSGSSSAGGWPVVGTYEFGTFGATTSSILSNHLAQLTANPADLTVILVGANDLGNLARTSAETMSQITTFVNTLKANGHGNLLVCSLTPRASANNSLGSDGKTFAVRVQETNALIAANASVLGYRHHDWSTLITDGSGFWLAGYSGDNVHPSMRGSQVMGESLASDIVANYSLRPPLIDAAFIASLNPQNSPVATSFSTFTNEGSVAYSTVAGTDGLGDWRRITTTHNNSVTSYTQTFLNNTTLPAGVADGDLIQPVFEMRMLSPSAVGISTEAYVTGNGTTSRVLAYASGINTRLAFDGLFLGQPFAIQAATTPQVMVTIVGTCAVDVRRAGYRKVTSKVPPFI